MSAARMFEVDVSDVGEKLHMLAEEINETSTQSTVRLGVGAARALAQATEPRKSTVGSRKKKAAAAMRRVVEPMGARDFNKLRKQAKPRVKLGGQWYPLDKRNLIDDDRQLWRIIEGNRVNGKTKKRPPGFRYICKQATFNKVATRRAKLWGAAKGAWIGAGQDIARTQKGLNRINIGKNLLGWAHHHARKGRGRVAVSNFRAEVTLVNNTTGAAKSDGLPQKRISDALHKARKLMWNYYRERLRSMKVKGKGGR